MTDCMTSEATDDLDNMVDCSLGCPRCYERHVDELVWLDDEQVECQSCKYVYEP